MIASTCILLLAATSLTAAQSSPAPTATPSSPVPVTLTTTGASNPTTAVTDPNTSTITAGNTTATGGSSAGTTTTAGNTTATTTAGNTTATTTGGSAAGTNAGATLPTKCTDDACCQSIESGKQPCTSCTNVEGCTFYGLFNNNVFQAGGKCLLSTATEVPTGHKKIEKVTECADLCDDFECDACLGITGCVWCDTGKAIGDAVGISTSTGSCELAKCGTGVTASTSCPSSAASNALAAVAALVAFAVAAL